MNRSLVTLLLLPLFVAAAPSFFIEDTTPDLPFAIACGLPQNLTDLQLQLQEFHESPTPDQVNPLLEVIGSLRQAVIKNQHRIDRGPIDHQEGQFLTSFFWQLGKSQCKSIRRYLELNAGELSAYQKGLGDLHFENDQELSESIKEIAMKFQSIFTKMATLGQQIEDYEKGNSTVKTKEAKEAIGKVFQEEISGMSEFSAETNRAIMSYVERKYTANQVLSMQGQSEVESNLAVNHQMIEFLKQQYTLFENTN